MLIQCMTSMGMMILRVDGVNGNCENGDIWFFSHSSVSFPFHFFSFFHWFSYSASLKKMYSGWYAGRGVKGLARSSINTGGSRSKRWVTHEDRDHSWDWFRSGGPNLVSIRWKLWELVDFFFGHVMALFDLFDLKHCQMDRATSCGCGYGFGCYLWLSISPYRGLISL